MKICKLLLSMAVLLVCVCTARADGSSSTVAQYDITGSLTLAGNNACGGTCTETVNFSFTLDYNSTSSSPVGTSYDPVQQGPFSLSASGPMSLSTGNCCSNFSPSSGVIEITNGVTGTLNNYDEIDLQLIFGSNPNSAPTLGYAEIFACGSTACVQDFSPYGIATYGEAIPISSAQLTATSMPVPEPPVWMLLFSGLVGLILLRAIFMQRQARQQACAA
jgi:hypothetical protein